MVTKLISYTERALSEIGGDKRLQFTSVMMALESDEEPQPSCSPTAWQKQPGKAGLAQPSLAKPLAPSW